MSSISVSVSEECMNDSSFGEICVHCNCCGRYCRETMKDAQVEYYTESLSDLRAFKDWSGDPSLRASQEANHQTYIDAVVGKLANLGVVM